MAPVNLELVLYEAVRNTEDCTRRMQSTTNQSRMMPYNFSGLVDTFNITTSCGRSQTLKVRCLNVLIFDIQNKRLLYATAVDVAASAIAADGTKERRNFYAL